MEAILERMLDLLVDPETPADAVRAVLAHVPWLLLQSVAASPRTPVGVLEMLLEPSQNLGRWLDCVNYVVQNPNCPLHIIESLSSHDNPMIRGFVAMCPRAPVAVLERLLCEHDEWLALDLARNPALPPDLLERLRNDPSDRVRDSVQQVLTMSVNIGRW